MNNQNMNSISPRRLGLAFFLTGVVFYLACILTMITSPYDKQIIFFNSLLHGIDVSPILRTTVPYGEVLLGIISTFILAWFAGAMVAGFYNLSIGKDKDERRRERSRMARNQGTPDVLHTLLLLAIMPTSDE